jgi:hypothetical protein
VTEQPGRQGVGVNGWTRAFLAAEKRPPLTPAVIAAALVLSKFADYSTGGSARPSGATIARGAGVHRATVAHALAGLVSVGWIEVESKPQGAPWVYRLTVPEGSVSGGVPVSDGVPVSHGGTPPSETEVPPHLSPYNPSIDPAMDLSQRDLSSISTESPSRRPSAPRRPDPWDEEHGASDGRVRAPARARQGPQRRGGY